MTARKLPAPTAHTLLNSYDSLSTVLTLPRSTLLNDPRLSESSAAFLALVGAMSFRYADRFHRSDLVVMDAVAVSRLLAPHFQGHAVERVCAICVDRDFHLLGSGAVVTHGDADNTALPIRRILSLALSSEAYGVILAHNHPDGAPLLLPGGPDDHPCASRKVGRAGRLSAGPLHLGVRPRDLPL